MPEPTGLHTPITNILPSESTVAAPQISPGSLGFGDEVALEAGAQIEPVHKPEAALMEAAEFLAPDISNFQDIGVASFGRPAQLEAVIGTDERVQITDTQQYPWRLNASLLITAADNSQWIGTAWFISPRTLVTAGHCVFIKHSGIEGRDGWVKKIHVIPGRNGSESPFGGITATEFFSVKGWGEDGLETVDYGAIILPSAFQQDLGSFAFGVFDDAHLLDSVANVAGYPSDKPRGTLWYDFRGISNVNPDKVFYAADTVGGQSGACVYIVDNGNRIGVAIHAYGGNTANSGTRISSQAFANLQSWKRT